MSTHDLRRTGDRSRAGRRRGRRRGDRRHRRRAGVATALIALLIAGHRSGRIDWLDRAARGHERADRAAGWAALPLRVLNASLLTAVLGMYWDISLHIDNGRDAGPLANPAHYLILRRPLRRAARRRAVAPRWPGERPSRTAVALGGGWWAPVGGLMIAACGAFALVGLPARRPLAPALRPGRDALGPDPPDADRRRLAGHARRAWRCQSEAIGELGRDPEREPPRAARRCSAAACSPAASWSRCRPSRASSTSACRSSAWCCSPS